MTESTRLPGGLTASYAEVDRARVAALLDGITSDAAAHLAFVSRAAIASDGWAAEIAAAREAGRKVIPVLLERIDLPPDLADADPVIEAYDDQPDTNKRRAFLLALAAAGVTAAGSDEAEAATLGAETATRESAGAASSGSARVVHADPLAKSNAAVVKTSSSVSARTLAFGGAAAATVLVVGAVILFQGRNDRSDAVSAGVGNPQVASSSTAAADRETANPATPSPTPEDIETGGARVILQQDSYPVGRAIPIRVVGMPGGQNDYVAIAEAGSPGYGELRYEYMKGRKEADIVLRGVMKPGNYEVRLFFGNDLERNKSETIRFSTPLTITPAAPITITPEKATLYEGDPVRISYAGLPENEKDWIATAEAGSPDGNYIAYEYSGGAAAGTMELRPLTAPGKYEIRVYFDDLASDRVVQARVPIEVLPARPVKLSLDASSYAPGATITLSYESMPGNRKDWFALARVGDPGYLTYDYTDGASSGTETFRAPDEPGAYEFRAYFDDSSGDRQIRAQIGFTVGPVTTPPATP